MSEKSSESYSAWQQSSMYKEGNKKLENLSDQALIYVYKEMLQTYGFEVDKWNALREKPTFLLNDAGRGFFQGGVDSKMIDQQDNTTAASRRALNVVLAEIRKRNIS